MRKQIRCHGVLFKKAKYSNELGIRNQYVHR